MPGRQQGGGAQHGGRGGEGERGTEHQLTASLQDHHNQNSLYQILTHHITICLV